MHPRKNRPLRVLHLVHWLRRGGIESWLLNVLSHVDRAELAIDICCKGPNLGDLAPLARNCGAQVLHCPQGLSPLAFAKRLKQHLQAGKYDLLHCHTHFQSGPAIWAARMAGVPSVNTHHSLVYFPETIFSRTLRLPSAKAIYAKASMRYALDNATIATGVSKGVVQAVEQGAGRPNSGCRVFHLGVQQPATIDDDQRDAYRQEFKIPDDAPVIAHVGSFTPPKNHPAILSTFRKVLDERPEAVLLLVGDGPLRPAIEQQIQQLAIANNVRLLGQRHDATIVTQIADLFLFPSVTEGLSLALMEAHSVGLPIVASNIAGNWEACRNGELGLLHDPHDVDQLAASALKVLNEPQRAARMGEQGQAFFTSEFSLKASVDRLQALYSEAIERENPIAAPPKTLCAEAA